MKKIVYLTLMLMVVNINANAGDFWGVNASNLSLGGSQTSGVDDYTATYYNPAKLPFIGLSNGLGYQFSKYNLFINLKDNRSESTKKFFRTNIPKRLQDGYSSYTIGFTLPIFSTDNYGLNIGFVNNYIENDVAKISVFDEKLYQYYKYHSNVETLLMNLGIGFKFLKHFSIGIGVAQLVSVIGATNVQFKLGQDDDDDPANDSIISGKDLYLGVVNERAYNISFFANYSIYSVGLIYKQDLSLPYKIPASITLKDFNGEGNDAKIDLLIKGVGVWVPPKLELGFSINLEKYIYSSIHLNISYELWGNAPAPYSFTSINSNANLLKIEDLNSYKGLVKYRDIINLSLACSFLFLKYNKLNFAFAYRPSVITKHDRFTNIIDTDIMAYSIGFKIKLLSLFNSSQSLFLNLAYSLQQSIAKNEYSYYYKSDVNYGGNIHLFFVDISYE